ncbi:MAG TPA: hydrogenase maturation nickel metallochaperone HypA [Candidatus Baltobacteraceae bacterium]|nr:hydrogenase maturation nickel metallochaperone HypA [Candidatus Baltobacteraceae bacterium]
MHEASIALAIVDEVCERASAERIARVTMVRVRIGALTSVVPDALLFAWELATDGTVASGSRLEIEPVPLAIECAPCGAERIIERGSLPVCPECGTSSNTILRGRELIVNAMEVEYAPASGGRSTEHPSQEHYAGA